MLLSLLYFCCCLAFSSLGGTYQQCLHLLLRTSDECLLLPGSTVGASAASVLSKRCVKSLRSSEGRHLPVASSNCQPCMVHVRMPSSILPKRVRSALRCGQRRWMREPLLSQNLCSGSV